MKLASLVNDYGLREAEGDLHYVPLSPRVEQCNMSRSPFGTPVTAAV